MRRVPLHWWCVFSIAVTTAVAAAVGQLAAYAPGGASYPRWEIVSMAIGGITVILLPAAAGWLWRAWFLACFAVGSAFFVGLVLADLLTYQTVSHNCNFPQPDACDPGPLPATMLLVALPLPLLCAVLGAVARAVSDERRQGRGEKPHLFVGADRHANRTRRPEGA